MHLLLAFSLVKKETEATHCGKSRGFSHTRCYFIHLVDFLEILCRPCVLAPALALSSSPPRNTARLGVSITLLDRTICHHMLPYVTIPRWQVWFGDILFSTKAEGYDCFSAAYFFSLLLCVFCFNAFFERHFLNHIGFGESFQEYVCRSPYAPRSQRINC